MYDLEHHIRSTRSSGAGGGGGLVRSLKRHRAARAAAASGSGGRGTLYSRATKRGGGLLRGSSLPVIKLAHVGGHRHRPTASSSSSSMSSSAEKRGIKLLRMLDMRCEVDLASLYISIFVNWEHSRGGPSFEHRRGGLDHSGEEGGLGHRIRRESGEEEEEEGEEIDIDGDVSRE